MITSPTDNSVYKIDSTLPKEYQNIFIKTYIPENIISANLYCDDKIIAGIEELKSGNIRWKLEEGEHSFYIKAVNKENQNLNSIKVNIFVQ